MKKQALWQIALIGLIAVLVVVICAGLAMGGVVLYVRGTAAVQAGTAETVFTREQAADMLRLFVIPALLLVALLILAALTSVKSAQNLSADRKLAASVQSAESVSAYRGLGGKRIWLILLIAAVLIAAGILNGGLRDVLIKAINICTECIGLG